MFTIDAETESGKADVNKRVTDEEAAKAQLVKAVDDADKGITDAENGIKAASG